MQIRNFGVQAYGLGFAKPYEFKTDGESEGWGFTNMVEVGSDGALDGKWMLTVPRSRMAFVANHQPIALFN